MKIGSMNRILFSAMLSLFALCLLGLSAADANAQMRGNTGGFQQGGMGHPGMNYGGAGFGGVNQRGMSGMGGFNQGGFNQGGFNQQQGIGSSRMSTRGTAGQASSRLGAQSAVGAQNFGAAGATGRGSRMSGARTQTQFNAQPGGQNFNAPQGGQNYIRYGGQDQAGQPGQTAPSQQSTDRRQALSAQGTGAREGASGGVTVDGSTQPRVEGQQPAVQDGRTRVTRQIQDLRQQRQQQQQGAAAAPESTIRQTTSLYLHTRNSYALLDEPFNVDIMLSNPRNRKFDEISFLLTFDPHVLKPIVRNGEPGEWQTAARLDFSPNPTQEETMRQSVEGNDGPMYFIHARSNRYDIVTNEVDAANGKIRFTARVRGESSEDDGVIARLRFLPLVEANRTSIRFEFEEEPGLDAGEEQLTTYLQHQGNDQLGSPFSDRDGVVNLTISIYESVEQTREPMRIDQSGERGKIRPGDMMAPTQMRLQLMPRKQVVDIGEIFEVDVYLHNPDREEIDAVSLLIAYNPRILQPVDGDDLSPGINLASSPHEDRFPFDLSIINSVDEERGLIDFRKRSYINTVNAEGVVATMRFRAIRPTTKTTFRILVNANGEDPTTGVFLRNRDALGDPSDLYDGLITTSIEIRPTVAYLNWLRQNGEQG